VLRKAACRLLFWPDWAVRGLLRATPSRDILDAGGVRVRTAVAKGIPQPLKFVPSSISRQAGLGNSEQVHGAKIVVLSEDIIWREDGVLRRNDVFGCDGVRLWTKGACAGFAETKSWEAREVERIG
jgi:hypothetical protein